ncbi:MAG: topoisomerase DNA-binding C4 zinc finger domain-containing protein [Anaerolineaceae bacterium]|nr:topoisomerase DNA-binding C4 zinc finger domain-containing protein [Anaerolineaceae bacterium]
MTHQIFSTLSVNLIKTNATPLPSHAHRKTRKSLQASSPPKSGPNQGKRFWGCSNYPQCKNIVQIEE